MSVRLIYYKASEREEKGDLALRRTSEIFAEDNFSYKDLFTLEQREKGWLFTPKKGATIFHDEKLLSGPLEIVNGFSFNTSEVFYKILSEYPVVERSRNMKIINWITAVFVSLVILMEIFVVVWLPYDLSKAEDLGREKMVQRSELLLDRLRSKTRNVSKEKAPLHQHATEFVNSQLNILADYFRKNHQRMSVEEVNNFYQLLIKYQDVEAMLGENFNVFQQTRPDLNGWINSRLEGKQEVK
ncbi:MAG: hypothetical protein ACRC37_07310 [Lentisphaeria bacterium]